MSEQQHTSKEWLEEQIIDVLRQSGNVFILNFVIFFWVSGHLQIGTLVEFPVWVEESYRVLQGVPGEKWGQLHIFTLFGFAAEVIVVAGYSLLRFGQED